MNLALFSQTSVREFYDATVTQAAEGRVFNVPDTELRTMPARNLVEGIIALYSPGRLVLDPVINEEAHAIPEQRRHIRRWMEFCGSVRLLTLRPRQYYSSPPHVSLLQPPAVAAAGRIVLEQIVHGVAEEMLFDEYCASEFRKISDYVEWINEDLDYYEMIARDWLLTLIEGKARHASSDRIEVRETRGQ